MSTFIEVVNRIAADLRRSNIATEIKQAINDAIKEAAKTRFYFNEMHVSFPTVPGTEYYTDLGLTTVDNAWYTDVSSTKYGVDVVSQINLDDLNDGNPASGQLELISRYGGQFRLYPIPTSVVTVHVDGFGQLTPYPLVNDGDTNAWLSDAELYIKALAKRNVLRDVIRDYGEARVLESIAEDYKQLLVEETNMKIGDNIIRSTRF